MDAQDFSRGTGNGFAFGFDTPDNAAARLRAFADDLVAGRVILAKVHTSAGATGDEFTKRSLVIRYIEKREA